MKTRKTEGRYRLTEETAAAAIHGPETLTLTFDLPGNKIENGEIIRRSNYTVQLWTPVAAREIYPSTVGCFAEYKIMHHKTTLSRQSNILNWEMYKDMG